MSEKIWRVYRHICPDGMIYVGVTSMKLHRRWKPYAYKSSSLEKYIDEFGWENITHEVIYTCYERDEAHAIEDMMIEYWSEQNICINERRSGLISKIDRKKYVVEYRESHRDEINERSRKNYKKDPERRKAISKRFRQNHLEKEKERVRNYSRRFYKTPEGKIYKRVASYNKHHPDNITITPAQAKFEYVNYSFVPSFIKHDDIPNAIPIIPSEWEWCKR